MKPVVYPWIAADAAAIAIVQSGLTNLVLNGTLASKTPGNQFVDLIPLSRVVTLTSAGNNSGVNFTIHGTLNGSAVSEAIVGPNANTVTTTVFFDTVTSITADGVFLNVSAGTGQTGATRWYIHDYNKTGSPPNIGIQVAVTGAPGAITYSYQVTLDNVQDRNIANFTVFSPIAAMTAATTNQLANYTNSVFASRILVTASVGAATLTETICQQGIV